jgi:hypothetical protein
VSFFSSHTGERDGFYWVACHLRMSESSAEVLEKCKSNFRAAAELGQGFLFLKKSFCFC